MASSTEPTRYESFVPAAKSRMKSRTSSSTELPKSGSAMHRATSSPASSRCGRNPMENVATFSRFFASEYARYTTQVNLAISAGWRLSPGIAEPPPRPADDRADARDQHQHQEHDAHQQHRVGQPGEPPVPHPDGGGHHHQAHAGGEQLPLEEVEPVALLLGRGDRAGRVHHHQPERDERQHRAEQHRIHRQAHRLGAAVGQRRRGRAGPARSITRAPPPARGTCPRGARSCGTDRRSAQAGESRTTSPGRARARARSTARSSVSQG